MLRHVAVRLMWPGGSTCDVTIGTSVILPASEGGRAAYEWATSVGPEIRKRLGHAVVRAIRDDPSDGEAGLADGMAADLADARRDRDAAVHALRDMAQRCDAARANAAKRERNTPSFWAHYHGQGEAFSITGDWARKALAKIGGGQ